MERELERRMELASEIAALKAEVSHIHRENQIRHDNFMREKGVQDELIGALSKDVKELLALANQSRGGFWAGMSIASGIGAVASWAISHFWFFPKA